MNNEINTEKKPASNSNEKKLSAGAGGGKGRLVISLSRVHKRRRTLMKQSIKKHRGSKSRQAHTAQRSIKTREELRQKAEMSKASVKNSSKSDRR